MPTDKVYAAPPPRHGRNLFRRIQLWWDYRKWRDLMKDEHWEPLAEAHIPFRWSTWREREKKAK